MPPVRSAVIRREIERHQQARLEELIEELKRERGENRREAIGRAHSLAETHRALSLLYDSLGRHIEEQSVSSREKPSEDLFDSTAWRSIEAHETTLRALFTLLSGTASVDALLRARLNRLAEDHADALPEDEVVGALKVVLDEALARERKESRVAREAEEWTDLPEYRGEVEGTRSECLRCGQRLHEARKSFCSAHCRDVHQAVFGVLPGYADIEDNDE